MSIRKSLLALAAVVLTRIALADENQSLQEWVDRTPWRWEEPSLLKCMFEFREFQIELIRPPNLHPGMADALTIRFVKDGKEIHSWRGHGRSVFIQQGNLLVYALYGQQTPGCMLVCVNLESGKVLWKNELKAVDVAAHSAYGNVVAMNEFHGHVMVWGNESLGKYVEVVDIKTGKTLAHKQFPRDQP